MKRLLIFTLTLTLTLAATATPVKFSSDQCRVLRQMKIDVTGICPPVSKKVRK